MDVVLVGLSGAGKNRAGSVLAGRHGAELVDTDALVEAEAGRSIAAIFADEGEAGFRSREAAVIASLPAPTTGPTIERLIVTGGGAVAGPRNRWHLFPGRAVVGIDAPTTVLAERVAAEAGSRPLLGAADRHATLERLRAEREPYYAAADARVDGAGSPDDVASAIEAAVRFADAEHPRGAAAAGTAGVLLRRSSLGGRFVLGAGIAARGLEDALRDAGARRAVLVSEPVAWRHVGEAVAATLMSHGWGVERLLLPTGEAAKRLSVVEAASEQLAALGLERGEPIVAIGGGALTDVAGFVAASYARGVPWIAVPTTLVGQLDAAIGGKTAVDLAAGKNLVGSFHPPLAIVLDVAALASLPVRERRAALGEAVKAGVLGDPALLERLSVDGPEIALGTPASVASGALAELVERAAVIKLEAVERDPREDGERIALNLGHTVGHAIERAAGFRDIRHGEAVAYGLRAAARLAVLRSVAIAQRAASIEAILDRLDLAVEPLPYPADEVLADLSTDKKRRGGHLRWVLPTDAGWQIDDEIPSELVAAVVGDVLAGRPTTAGRIAAAVA